MARSKSKSKPRGRRTRTPIAKIATTVRTRKRQPLGAIKIALPQIKRPQKKVAITVRNKRRATLMATVARRAVRRVALTIPLPKKPHKNPPPGQAVRRTGPLLAARPTKRDPHAHCKKRNERRRVIFAMGKAIKSGGAPGRNHHYRRTADSEKSC